MFFSRNLFEKSRVEEVDVPEKVKKDERIAKIVEELKEFKWIYGKSPRFVFSASDGSKVEVKDGLVVGNNTPFTPSL